MVDFYGKWIGKYTMHDATPESRLVDLNIHGFSKVFVISDFQTGLHRDFLVKTVIRSHLGKV